MTTNNEESFMITVRKSSSSDIARFSSESLIKSLLEKGSMFGVIEITQLAKKKSNS